MIKLPPQHSWENAVNTRDHVFWLTWLSAQIAWTPAKKAVAHYFDPDWYYQNEEKYGLPIIKAVDIEPSFGESAEYYCRNREAFVAFSLKVLRGFAIERVSDLRKDVRGVLTHCYQTGDYGEKWLKIIDRLLKPFFVMDRCGGDTCHPKCITLKPDFRFKLLRYVQAYDFAADRFRFEDALEYKPEGDYFGVFYSDSIFKGK